MSSTLLTEASGQPFDELQAQQLEAFREAWREAGHVGEPRTSVSRSIFPITTAEEQMYFGGRQDGDQIGVIDGMRSTFGKTYAAEPDVLVEQLLQDAAIRSADTLMLTIPSQLGVEFNLRSSSRSRSSWRPRSAGRAPGSDATERVRSVRTSRAPDPSRRPWAALR
jgi:hypothetical protein